MFKGSKDLKVECISKRISTPTHTNTITGRYIHFLDLEANGINKVKCLFIYHVAQEELITFFCWERRSKQFQQKQFQQSFSQTKESFKMFYDRMKKYRKQEYVQLIFFF